MEDQDCLQRFTFEDFAVRGQIVHLDLAWKTVLARHDYPAKLRPVLGQAMAATVLLAATLKFNGRLTLQAQGNGPLNLLVMQCTDDLQVRGLARWRSAVVTDNFSAQVGEGTLSMTVQTEARPQPYQGIVPLTGESINDCLANYFDSSEQLPTQMWLVADDERVAGLLLQRMPDKDPSVAESDWRRVQMLTSTIRDSELLTLSNEQILQRLFHQERLRVFDRRPVRFNCSCDSGRIEQVLRSLGEAELRAILVEQGRIAVGCEFCARNHQFDPVDVTRILAGAADQGGSGSLH